MSSPKTAENDASVDDFLSLVQDEQKRANLAVIREMMAAATGAPARMWGTGIVGFGRYTMTYANGKTGQWMLTGFAPRKTSLVLYIMPGFERRPDLMERLGKHKVGKSCLYVKKLADVDIAVLRELIDEAVAYMREKYASEV